MPLSINILYFKSYILPYYLYFSPLVIIQNKIINTIEDIQKSLRFNKNDYKYNLNKYCGIKSIKFWGEYFLITNFLKLEYETNNNSIK